MGKKEDWEELEKWNQRKEEENKEQYGIDLLNISNEHKKIFKGIKLHRKNVYWKWDYYFSYRFVLVNCSYVDNIIKSKKLFLHRCKKRH